MCLAQQCRGPPSVWPVSCQPPPPPLCSSTISTGHKVQLYPNSTVTSLLQWFARLHHWELENTSIYMWPAGIGRHSCQYQHPNFYFSLNGTMVYRMNIALHWRGLETRDSDHKLLRTIFTDVINLLVIWEKTGFSDFPIGFTLRTSICISSL